MEINQYFDKYKYLEFNESTIGAYIGDLNKDLETLIASNTEKTARAYADAVILVNDKHNAIMALFDANGIGAPLIKDAFVVCARMLQPGIKRFFGTDKA